MHPCYRLAQSPHAPKLAARLVGIGTTVQVFAVWPSDHRRRSASCKATDSLTLGLRRRTAPLLAALTDRPLPGTLHCPAPLGVILPCQTG